MPKTQIPASKAAEVKRVQPKRIAKKSRPQEIKRSKKQITKNKPKNKK